VRLVDDAEQRFDRDSRAVVIMVEPDTKRIHKDFADVARTKQVLTSLSDRHAASAVCG
jgi:hypothetical protein